MKITFYLFASFCGKDKLFDINRMGFLFGLWFFVCKYLEDAVLIFSFATKKIKPLTKALIPTASS